MVSARLGLGAAVSGSVEGPLHHKSGCVCLGRDVGLAGPRPGTRGQTRPIGRVQHSFFVFFVFSWQPQEMLKRMVVYQTAFRQVKGSPSCVCGPLHLLLPLPL